MFVAVQDFIDVVPEVKQEAELGCGGFVEVIEISEPEVDIALIDVHGVCRLAKVVVAIDELDFDFFPAALFEGSHAALVLFEAIEVKAGVIE
jgi:hypothetical protein